MLTVLHYTGYTREGGGIVSVIHALHSTARFRVIHGVSEGYVASAMSADIELWHGPAIASEKIGPIEILRARRVARAVHAWLSEQPRRIFHGHTRAGLLVALWLRKWREQRVVVSVHCYGRQRWFYRWADRRLGARLHWLTPTMRSYYGAAGEGWTRCVPGGVADSAFSGVPPVPEPGRLRLGGAGALVRWKRWDLVLEAMARLSAESRAQVTFEHIGGPLDDADSRSYARELERLTQKLGLSDRVTWRGPEPTSRRLLSATDIVIVPSHNEPYSMVLQEAWAAGIPALAADSGGPRDLVKSAQNGWFFRDGDAEALAVVLDLRVRLRDWAQLDPTSIRLFARNAAAIAGDWAIIYGRYTP